MVTERKKRRSRKSERQYVVDSEGRRTGVILTIKEYEELLEDLYDLGLIAEAREEPSLTLEEMEERLRKDGIL
ncbi:MAG: hypothetical protein WD904_03865 [Dehalococcoidia bacterium]